MILRGITFKFSLSIAVIFLIITNLMGNVYSLEGLPGTEFSDPSGIMEMSETWKKKPVRHDPNKEDVDLVVNLDQQIYPNFYPLINDLELLLFLFH